MNTTTVIAGQLDMNDLIDRIVASAELRDDLIDRRSLPPASESGPERLLRKLVLGGLPETALHRAAGLVVTLEQQALDQKGSHDHLPARS